MLEAIKLVILTLQIKQGFKEQLTIQETFILHTVHPSQLSLSVLINMDKYYLDQLAYDLTDAIME